MIVFDNISLMCDKDKYRITAETFENISDILQQSTKSYLALLSTHFVASLNLIY